GARRASVPGPPEVLLVDRVRFERALRGRKRAAHPAIPRSRTAARRSHRPGKSASRSAGTSATSRAWPPRGVPTRGGRPLRCRPTGTGVRDVAGTKRVVRRFPDEAPRPGTKAAHQMDIRVVARPRRLPAWFALLLPPTVLRHRRTRGSAPP